MVSSILKHRKLDFLSECLVEVFCILRGVLKGTKIRMNLQLDDASIGFLAIQFDFWKKDLVYCVYAACHQNSF